jgi:UDP-N-acetylglucosamine 2-epimerase (non-hydrolysing)
MARRDRRSNGRLLASVLSLLLIAGVLRSTTPTTTTTTASNSRHRVYIFVGTRPEAIKLSPLATELSASAHFETHVVFSGQQPDLVEPFFQFFNVHPNIRLTGILVPGQSLSALLAKLITGFESALPKSRPSGDIWVVQGDTSTALAAAVVGFNRGVHVAHVEAGLRTYDMSSPFPEEFNRKTISSIAAFNFAPTQRAVENLLKENVPGNTIISGNTIIDAARFTQGKALSTPLVMQKCFQSIEDTKLVLLTLHRRETSAEKMREIYDTIASVSCPDCVFVVPLHPNPKARTAALRQCGADPRFLCPEALSYTDTHWVLAHAMIVLTDSGGLQEEASYYQLPALVLRDKTERPEGVSAGISAVVGDDMDKLAHLMGELLVPGSDARLSMSAKAFPYGRGNSSKTIAAALRKLLDEAL